MKHTKYTLNTSIAVFILVTSFLFSAKPLVAKGNIKVIVTNMRNKDGQIGFCLFRSSDGFPHPDKATIISFVKINSSSAEYTFTNIAPGTYAICVFHDENSDKILNTNFLGIPKEGVGVSNNVKGHFGPPKYDDAKFNFDQPEQTITISLSYL